MKHSSKLVSIAALIGLEACSTTPAVFQPLAAVPSVGTAAHDATANTYSVTVNGTTTDLVLTRTLWAGAHRAFYNPGTYSARGFQNSDALAIGGMTEGAARTPFAGVSGTLSPVQTSGSATFNGDISFVYPSTAVAIVNTRIRTLQLNADFAAGTIGQIFDGVTISGTITGSTFSGTVDWSSKSAPLAGGFFGTNTAAGAFSSTQLAGAFLGTNP